MEGSFVFLRTPTLYTRGCPLHQTQDIKVHHAVF